MTDLVVCGHANIDVHLRLDELPGDGTSHPVRERHTVYGGTAANIARHAGALGLDVRLWSRVGADFPADWRRDLERDGVDLRSLDVVADAQTPTCFILTDEAHRQTYCMDQGPMAAMAHHPPDPAVLAGLDGWLHLATGDPAAYLDLARHAEDAGIPVALDPGQEMRFLYDGATLRALLAHARTLFVNETELRVALGFLDLASAEELSEEVETLVVTHGAQGAHLHRRGRATVRMPSFEAPAVRDPTGAGDALRAGWHAALRHGHDMETALRWGQAAGCVAVQRRGGQAEPVRAEDLQRLLRAEPASPGPNP